jgi:hypothetical protein
VKGKDSKESVENSAKTLRLCYYSRNLQRTDILKSPDFGTPVSHFTLPKQRKKVLTQHETTALYYSTNPQRKSSPCFVLAGIQSSSPALPLTVTFPLDYQARLFHGFVQLGEKISDEVCDRTILVLPYCSQGST